MVCRVRWNRSLWWNPKHKLHIMKVSWSTSRISLDPTNMWSGSMQPANSKTTLLNSPAKFLTSAVSSFKVVLKIFCHINYCLWGPRQWFEAANGSKLPQWFRICNLMFLGWKNWMRKRTAWCNEWGWRKRRNPVLKYDISFIKLNAPEFQNIMRMYCTYIFLCSNLLHYALFAPESRAEIWAHASVGMIIGCQKRSRTIYVERGRIT